MSSGPFLRDAAQLSCSWPWSSSIEIYPGCPTVDLSKLFYYKNCLKYYFVIVPQRLKNMTIILTFDLIFTKN